MAPVPRVPAHLEGTSFTVAMARDAGLSKHQLRGRSWKRLGPATYIGAGRADSVEAALGAARWRVPDDAPFSGLTAAWIHGLDVPPCDPVEVTVPDGWGISARAGLAVKRAVLAKDEVERVGDWVVTTALRTIADLARRPPLWQAVAYIDMALRAGLIELAALDLWIGRHPRYRGVRLLRRAIELADGRAESPMESRLRVLLSGGRLSPVPQVELLDAGGEFVARADLYYEEARLVVEYDGGIHRDQLAEDNRRQNRLVNAGYRILRFTYGDITLTPETVRRQVDAALREQTIERRRRTLSTPPR